MWLLAVNGLVYLALGLVSGRFRRKLLPIRPREVLADAKAALAGQLAHDDLSVYNAVQRLLYRRRHPCRHRDRALGAGDLEAGAVAGADRAVRRLRRRALRAFLSPWRRSSGFIVIHVVMAFVVPKSLRAMITGR